MTGMILVIGSINTDLVTTTQRMPLAGETVMARDFAMLPGGKGANQAVAASRLGAKTMLAGRVGNDAFGHLSLQGLQNAGVAVDRVLVTPGVASGVATIVVEEGGENRILVVSGANALVTPADIPDALLALAKIVVLQLEIPIDTVYDVIARAPVPVNLNPAPAAKLDPAKLVGLGYLIPNQHELSEITGLPTTRSDEVVAAARRLIRQGVGTVIVTLGGDGAMLVTRERVAHVEAPTVKPVDTTGAGDAFIGCFAATLMQTGDVDAALARAVRYASLSVTRFGAQGSYATAAEFEATLARDAAG
jgi:ribokinase